MGTVLSYFESELHKNPTSLHVKLKHFNFHFIPDLLLSLAPGNNELKDQAAQQALEEAAAALVSQYLVAVVVTVVIAVVVIAAVIAVVVVAVVITVAVVLLF